MTVAVVHVVDDDEPMRGSLNLLLGAAGYEVRTYEGAGALLKRIADLEPGCIVTDVRMPEMDGLKLIGELKRNGLSHPVIIMTGHADVPLAVQAMKAGVVEFIEKPFEERLLLDAVELALRTRADAAVVEVERLEFNRRLMQLTEREREVFEAIVEGESNKEAARRLGISPRTIEIYRANMMFKMQADSLSHLIRMAMRHGSK